MLCSPSPPFPPHISPARFPPQATVSTVPAMPLIQAVLKDRSHTLALAPLPDDLIGTPAAAAAAAAAASSAGAGGIGSGGLSINPPSSSSSSSSSNLAPRSRPTSPPAAPAPSSSSGRPSFSGTSPPTSPSSTLNPSAGFRVQPDAPMSVWQGQRCSWSLVLTNYGTTPAHSLQVSVANHRGALLKPLPQV